MSRQLMDAEGAQLCPSSPNAQASQSSKAIGQYDSTTGRTLVSQVSGTIQTATGVASSVIAWVPGFLRRVTSKDSLALGIDSVMFAAVQLPPVAFDRTMDLSAAMLRVNPLAFVYDPKASVAMATQRSLDVMGGGFVKIAQVISHSPALFPASLVSACKASLAHATTVPTHPEDVEQMVLKELSLTSLREAFDFFEAHPIASASIAQVHRARLITGEECVVKIVRPKVKKRLLADFQALLLFARLGDLVLGKDVIQLMVNRSLERCIGELYNAIMAECDLNLERQNMAIFRNWLSTSSSLRRMGLEASVFAPKTYAHVSGETVLTMDFVRGPTLSELAADATTSAEDYQPALIRALTVAALSIIDGPALFHADLHSGNMIMVRGPSNAFDRVAFIDFGCCGTLPEPLRKCLMMQASSFAQNRPNIKQFCGGFQHALDGMPGLGPRPQDLDVDAIARDLKPLLKEIQSKNPFRAGADPMDPELHALVFRLQMLLCYHGVQVPCEFILLMKTACFAALYFSLLDDTHRDQLLGQLLFSGAAHASCHPREAISTLSRGTLMAFAKLLWAKKKQQLAPVAKVLACATTASIPLLVLTRQYLISDGDMAM